MKLIRYFILIALFSTFQVIIFGQCNLQDQIEKIEAEMNANNYLAVKSLIHDVELNCKNELKKMVEIPHWFAVLNANVDYVLQPDSSLVHSIKSPFEYFLRNNKTHNAKYASATIVYSNILILCNRLNEALIILNNLKEFIESSGYKLDLDYLTCLNNIGAIYYFQSKYEDAIAVYRIAEKKLDEMHLTESNNFMQIKTNLGSIYFMMSKHKEALAETEQALIVNEKINGKDHFSSSKIVNTLGLVSSQIGDKKNALRYYLKALELANQAPLIDSLLITEYNRNILVLYIDDNKIDEPLKLLLIQQIF